MAIFRFRVDGPVYAITNACPHVSIGALAYGDAVDYPDLEDSPGGCAPAVNCPVHAFTFDLITGQCVSDHPGQRSEPATVYPALMHEGRVFIRTDPKPRMSKFGRIMGQDAGFSIQMRIVEKGLARKFGPE